MLLQVNVRHQLLIYVPVKELRPPLLPVQERRAPPPVQWRPGDRFSSQAQAPGQIIFCPKIQWPKVNKTFDLLGEGSEYPPPRNVSSDPWQEGEEGPNRSAPLALGGSGPHLSAPVLLLGGLGLNNPQPFRAFLPDKEVEEWWCPPNPPSCAIFADLLRNPMKTLVADSCLRRRGVHFYLDPAFVGPCASVNLFRARATSHGPDVLPSENPSLYISRV